MNDIKTGEDNLTMGMSVKEFYRQYNEKLNNHLNQINELHKLDYSEIKADSLDDKHNKNIVSKLILDILFELKNTINNLNERIKMVEEKINIEKKNSIKTCNYKLQKVCKNCKYFDEKYDYCEKIDWYVDKNGICDYYEDKDTLCISCLYYNDETNFCNYFENYIENDINKCDKYKKRG